MFSTLSKSEFIIYVTSILLSANAVNLDKVNFLSSGNGLKISGLRGNFKASSFAAQSRILTTLRKRPFENVVGKGEHAGYHYFLHLSQCFLPYAWHISCFK